MSNLFIIFQALAFLGTVVLLAGLGLGTVVALFTGRTSLARWLALAGGVLVSMYVALLLLASLFSREEVLAVGTPKYFCEIDCHVTHAVIEATTTDTLGGTRAAGTFYLVKVRTWFDPTTTSPSRPKDAVVYPNPRRVWLLDGTGRRLAPSAEGMAALAKSGQAGTPIDQPLLPDASYITGYAFDVPAGVKPARLWIAPADPVSRFLIGQELSPWHAKVLMALPGT
jgi:hypothetical protein